MLHLLGLPRVFALFAPGTIIPGTDSFVETGLILQQCKNVSVHPGGKGYGSHSQDVAENGVHKMGCIKGNKK